MIGFRFDEIMSGWHVFGKNLDLSVSLDKLRHYPMEFRITWGPDNLMEWLNPFGKKFMKQSASGTITIAGFCNAASCKGTLELQYHKGLIRYTLYFNHNDSNYVYTGEKRNIRPWNLHRTHTTCYGKLMKMGVSGPEVISESITYFHRRTLPAFLKSFRWTNE